MAYTIKVDEEISDIFTSPLSRCS